MSGFDLDWLALREGVDAPARALDWSRSRVGCPSSATDGARLKILDLATGTGANLRYLAPRIGGCQAWLLVDSDPALLAALPEIMRRWADAQGYGFRMVKGVLRIFGADLDCQVRALQMDLSADLDRLPIHDQTLVSASALLDLVSERWLAGLLDRCRAAEADLLFALSYDGRIGLEPIDPEDVLIASLVNRHQRTDKGFGPALGPKASGNAESAMADRGYRVARGPSDWHIDPTQHQLQTALLRGWAEVAEAVAPELVERARGWLARRVRHLQDGVSWIRVGHQDLMGWRE